MQFRRFWGADDGGVAVILAFSIVAIGGISGAAIDFVRAFNARTELQSKLDTVVFSVARQAARTENQLMDMMRSQMRAHPVESHDFVMSKLEATMGDDGALRASASGHIKSTFASILGISRIDITARSAVKIGVDEMDVVLVLDTTGSMNGGKLDALKSAAKELVTHVYDQDSASDKVAFAIVPFSRYVNVGLSRRNESWIDVPSDYTNTSNYCSTPSTPIDGTCGNETRTCYNDGVPYSCTVQVCQYETGPETCQDATYSYVWSGCVGSRDAPLDESDSDYGTKIPGLLNTSCPSELTPLSKSRSTLVGAIDSLTATGETYIPAGLMWGWRALSSPEPLTGGQAKQKYIVLMSDGANTKSATYPNHSGSDVAAANAKTASVCEKIKAAGIEVFTVAFEVTDPATKQLLENCASTGGGYFDASDSASLVRSFQKISDQMIALQLLE